MPNQRYLRYTKVCRWCSGFYVATRNNARTGGPKCRQYRRRYDRAMARYWATPMQSAELPHFRTEPGADELHGTGRTCPSYDGRWGEPQLERVELGRGLYITRG